MISILLVCNARISGRQDSSVRETSLELKFLKNKVIMRRGLLTGSLSFVCCLNHLNSALAMSLYSSFRIHLILHLFCSNALLTPQPRHGPASSPWPQEEGMVEFSE